MNKHFEDTKYYLQRAGEHAKQGLSEELEPVQERVRELTDDDEVVIDDDDSDTRLDQLRSDLDDLQIRTADETTKAIRSAREQLTSLRNDSTDT